MKTVSTLLLIALLSSTCVSAIAFARTVFQMNLNSAIEPAYTGTGSLVEYDVDYWWIPNISKDEVVLVNIVQDRTICYDSWLKYSNLTEFQHGWCFGTHNHDFVADKTDNYLLKIQASYGGFNYTITCDHPIWKEPMRIVRGNLSEGKVFNYWIPNVSKDKVFLMSVFQDRTICYDSWLYYSNLTELQHGWCFGTHNHDFVADKTDNYLLKIQASYGGFNYTIKHSATRTRVSFSLYPNPAWLGEVVTLVGNLTAHDNLPIDGAKVAVKSNGTQVATLTTNSTGWFKASGPVGSAGIFNVTVEYEGSGQYMPSSAWEILTVNQVKIETWIYAIFIPNPVTPGETCTLKGVLLDEFSNPIKLATVTLEYSTDYGLTWNSAGSLTTNSIGIFSTTFTAPSVGTYLVKISYAGSPSYESTTAVEPLIVR